MTLEEKAALVVGTGLQFGDEIDKNSPYRIPNQPLPGTLADRTTVYVVGAIGRTLEIPRLGISTIEMVDGPAGASLGSRTTAFPIGTALASTWNEPLIHQVGQRMGHETLELGLDLLLAPAINIHRNPLTGRNFEYFSEDPLLSGKIGAALIKGIQSQGVGTSLKHFVANNQETNRIEVDAEISQRALREIYLRGFEIAVKEANPLTLMASYNSVNGNLATENEDLLVKIARQDWGYEGIIVSDWEAGVDPVKQMQSGLNLILPGPYQDTVLIEAVKDGRLEEKTLDKNIEWILKGVMRTPKFRKYRYANAQEFQKNAEVAKEAAVEGMVLLKNREQALPLMQENNKVALFGNGSYETIVGGSGSGYVMTAGPTVHLFEGLKNEGFEVSTTLSALYESYIEQNTPEQNKIEIARGRKKRAPEMKLDNDMVMEVAQKNDLAIFTISRVSGESADRQVDDNFNLSAIEVSNLKAVVQSFHAKNKKVIVVLNVGGVIETSSWKALPDAILVAWQPGQVAGNAIAEVLAGQTTPSGKLTATFPESYEDEPSARNFPGTPLDKPKRVIYQEGIYIGYRYFDSFQVQPSYPFGFGLSYTDFTFRDLELSTATFDDSLLVSTTVTNTGNFNGKEVVQLYISAPAETMHKPRKELKGFVKTKKLKPGESQKVSFKLEAKDLASFDVGASAWSVEKGEYLIQIGKSSADIILTETFSVAAPLQVETVSRALTPQIEIEELTPKNE